MPISFIQVHVLLFIILTGEFTWLRFALGKGFVYSPVSSNTWKKQGSVLSIAAQA